MLRVEVRDNGRFWYVLFPELCGAGGWVDISRKFWDFCGWKRSNGLVDRRSFLAVANIDGWPANTVAVEEKGNKRRDCAVEVKVDSTQSITRYLVGNMENGATALPPSAMELQQWAQKLWKVTAGVQVSELGGASFLFTLPSAKEAQWASKGNWSFQRRRLKLEWWSPVGCCVKSGGMLRRYG